MNTPFLLSDGHTGCHGTCMQHCTPQVSDMFCLWHLQLPWFPALPANRGSTVEKQPVEKSNTSQIIGQLLGWMPVLKAYTLLIAEIFAWKRLSLNFLNTETFDTAHLCVKNKDICSFFLSFRDTVFFLQLWVFCCRHFDLWLFVTGY